MKFLDQAKVYVRSGDGGAGSNQVFISSAVAQAKAMGVSIGIYSSVYGWGSAVGEVMVHRFADDLEVALDRVD